MEVACILDLHFFAVQPACLLHRNPMTDTVGNEDDATAVRQGGSVEQYQSAGLADAFKSYFTVVPALTPALREETWRVRHEVYCRDLGWEPLQPNGFETDSDDQYSVACLLKSVTTGASIGCVRLILADARMPERLLPVELACAGTLDKALFDPATVDRSKVAEVSRLAVMRDYRRRKGEASKPIAIEQNDFGEEGRVRFPYIPVGLFMAVMAMAEQLGIDKLLTLTEPRLSAHLGKIGFHIVLIGSGVEHRGLRVPAVIDKEGFVEHMHPVIHAIWDHIRSLVAEGFAAASPQELQQLAALRGLAPGPG